MRSRAPDQVLLGLAGAGLAAIAAFAPFAYAYPLRVRPDPTFAAATFVGELLWVAAMVASHARDPAGRLWKLILGSRAVAALGVIWVVNTSLTWTLWQLSIGLATVVFAHLVLSVPSGRLEHRFDRTLVVAAYLAFLVSRIGLALVWDPRSAECFPRCQVNPFMVWPSTELTSLFGAVTILTPVLAVGVVVGLWRRWRAASPVLRRTLVPVALVAPLELGIATARSIAALSQDTWESVGIVLSTSPLAFVHAAIPAGFLAGILAARLSRGAIADLAVELGGGVPLGGLRATLARALRDPTLALAFPAPGGGNGLVDADGRPVDGTGMPEPGRGVARLERDGELLAVLDYDPAIEVEDPGRVHAVASVARMALENERLAAQVRAQLEEVRASRARIVEAADAERRRIERDLHDGAQQRLVALTMRLDQARGHVEGAGELIDATTDELLRAIGEVRDLAHGLHPTILTESGLAAAVESLAERAPIPVRASVTPSRLGTEVEVAAYFVVAETVTNAVKHAGASEVRIDASLDADHLSLTVADDGRGGADPEHGSGLQGLIDRVLAVGGTLTIDSPPGGGTTLHARIPATAR